VAVTSVDEVKRGVNLGDTVYHTVTFRTRLRRAIDPEVVTFQVHSPGAVTRTYTYGVDDELVRLSQGTYEIQTAADTAGTWNTKWTGAGTTLNKVITGQFVVRADNMT
jgi:hypothetical protein